MKKRDNLKLFFLSIIFIFLIVGVFSILSPNNSESSLSSTINYESLVCVFKNGEEIDCKHNVLFNNGAEAIEQILGTTSNTSTSAFQNISVCNSSTAGVGCGGVTAGQSEAYNLFSAGGLTQGAGTYFSNGNGNWTLSKTFTSTASSLTTNVTKLGNITGYNLSGNSFTAVTLNIDDQLTINWTLWVT